MYEKKVKQYRVKEKESGELEFEEAEGYEDNLQIDAGSAQVGLLDAKARAMKMPSKLEGESSNEKDDDETATGEEDEEKEETPKKKRKRNSSSSKKSRKGRKRNNSSKSESQSPAGKKNNKAELQQELRLEAGYIPMFPKTA